MIENFEGLGKRMPLTSLSLTIGGIATVGVPLFNVFWSKLRIILAAAHEGNLWPVALVLFASVVEAVYYFRLIHTMWFKGKSGERIPEGAIAIVLLLLAMLIIVIGVYPTPFWNLVTKAGSDIVEVSKYVANVLPGVKL